MPFDDFHTMYEDLPEQEGENANREHGQRDARPLRYEVDPSQRKTEVDREPRQGAEKNCFPKGHARGSITESVREP